MKTRISTVFALGILALIATVATFDTSLQAQGQQDVVGARILHDDGFGARWITGVNTEEITLSTGSVNSDSVNTGLLPANSVIEAVVGKVTTAITGTCSGWTLADSTTAGRFAASNTTLTTGGQSIGIVHWSGAITTLAAGPSQAAAAGVRIVCATGAASAGKVRVSVFYRQFVPPGR